MKFALGPVRENPDFHPEDNGWRKLREPGPFVMQLFAVPMGALAAAVVFLLIILFTPIGRDQHLFPDAALVIACVIIFWGIPVHEFLHMLAHPHHGRSPHTIIGFWPSRLLFYAHFDDQLSGNRFMAICVLPFLVLAVAPVAACMVLRVDWWWLGFLSVYNAFVSGGDLFGALMVLLQVPRDADVRNKGYYTWWKGRPTGGTP